jgi:hypothetical protein
MGHPMRQSALPLDRLPPNVLLEDAHYLGIARRSAWTYQDEFGVMVWTNPTSRYLPQHTWFELARWCLVGIPNGGSQQWRRARRLLFELFPAITTCVSYSDPSVGHTGAVYKACNWQWAPTWHRLKPPPTGNGSWDGKKQSGVKDRWVFPLRHDANRTEILRVKF